MSSPNMNNLIIVGCMIIYGAVVLLGADSNLVGQELFPKMCSARAWLLAVGFSLAFGSIFSKTWRVYSIFSNVSMNKKVIKDWILFLVVGVLVTIDVVILATWEIVDPFHRNVTYLPHVEEAGTDHIPVLEICVSNHSTIWLAIIYSYKGLLLLCGCFLAWETRNVSIPALNDSKYVGMSVYNVVIMCLSGAGISFILTDKPTAAFILISLFIIFCTTITLCLVFVPKIVELRKDPKGEHKRLRTVINSKKKVPSDHLDKQEKTARIISENKEYKNILQEKNIELEELLVELGEDDTSGISPAHRAILALCAEQRNSNLNLSPARKIALNNSFNSTYSADDSSMCSTSSNSNLWMLDSSSRVYLQQRSELESVASSTATEAMELTDLGNHKPSFSLVLPAITSSDHNLNIVKDDSDELSDPFGGVYVGEEKSQLSSPNSRSLHTDGIINNCELRETAVISDSEDTSTSGSLAESRMRTWLLQGNKKSQNEETNPTMRKHENNGFVHHQHNLKQRNVVKPNQNASSNKSYSDQRLIWASERTSNNNASHKSLTQKSEEMKPICDIIATV